MASINSEQFITAKSLRSLGTSSFIVFILCSVLYYIFTPSNTMWIALLGLILSIIISASLFLGKEKFHPQNFLLALLNGFLIFSTATGFNSFGSADWSFKPAKDTTKKTGMINIDVMQSSFFPIGTAWFKPKDLVDANETLYDNNRKLATERDSVVKINVKLTEEKNIKSPETPGMQKQIDSLNKLLAGSRRQTDSLDKALKKCTESNKGTGKDTSANLRALLDDCMKQNSQLKSENNKYKNGERLKELTTQLQNCEAELKRYKNK